VNYFFVAGKFFVKGGIQRGCPLLASGGVAVEQKSNVSAISCPTSNIACSKPRTHLKRRKLVRKKLQLIYREPTGAYTESLTNLYWKSTNSLLKNLHTDYKESIDGQQTVATKTNCNLQAFYTKSTAIYR
jgi:hypothetical protein